MLEALNCSKEYVILKRRSQKNINLARKVSYVDKKIIKSRYYYDLDAWGKSSRKSEQNF
jgi:hypothetical protein